MWQYLTASFLAGLALGPSCLLHCGAFQLVYVGRSAGMSRNRTAVVGALILSGRLLAYVFLGLLIGCVAGGSSFSLPSPWILSATIGLLMLYSAGFSGVLRPCSCRLIPTSWRSGALLLGFLTGLAPCPSMLASGVIALQSRGLTAALLTLVSFFAGSSICMLPTVFGLSLLPSGWRSLFSRAARFLALVVALYAFVLAALQFPVGPGSSAAPQPPVTTRTTRSQKAGATAEETSDSVSIPPPASPSVEPLNRKTRLKELLSEKLVQDYGLSLHEAMFYRKLAGNRVQCRLCPRGCLLRNGERGLCRVRANIDGSLRALTYARPVSLHADPIEKKPLYHVLPGSTALSVATVGCNSACVFCQNFEISQASPEDVRTLRIPPEKLVKAALARGDAGIAYTYTEPTVFYEYMLETARLAKAEGLRNYWITCGQIRQAPLEELCKVLDAANVDLKGFSDDFYVRYCDFHLAPVLNTLLTLDRAGVLVEVTNLLIPGGNDEPEMIRDMCRWIKQELGSDTPLHFSRFHPAYKLPRRPPTPKSTLLRARSIALEAGLQYVYIGNLRVDGGCDTVCGHCGKTLIRRSGFVVLENNVDEGCCRFCKARINGIW